MLLKWWIEQDSQSKCSPRVVRALSELYCGETAGKLQTILILFRNYEYMNTAIGELGDLESRNQSACK